MDSFSALNVFLAVAENLSFAAGARQLGLSPSATGKSISRFEARLGVRLFHRTTRQVSLTAEGELLLEQGRRIRDDLRDTEAMLSGTAAEPSGLLRLSLPAIGYRFLSPHLAEFRKRYPKISLDLDFSDRIADLTAEGIDLAIRSGALPDSGLMSRKLRHFRFIVCASPDFLAAHGEPRGIAELAEYPSIRFRHPGTARLQAWTFATSVQSNAMRRKPAIVCTNMEAVLAAAIAGLGIAQMPDFLAADAIASGELVPILRACETDGIFWLVWNGGRQRSPKLRALIDFADRVLTRDTPKPHKQQRSPKAP